MYRVRLTPEEQQELNRRAHAPGVMPRTRDRLEMVRLSNAGWSIPKIAEHLQISEARVRFWIKRYLAEGFDGLPDAPHPGQTSALTPEILAAVREAIEESGQTWSAPQVAAWVEERFRVRRTPDHVREMLGRAGLSYKRTHRSLKHKRDPAQVEEKRRQLAVLEWGGIGSD